MLCLPSRIGEYSNAAAIAAPTIGTATATRLRISGRQLIQCLRALGDGLTGRQVLMPIGQSGGHVFPVGGLFTLSMCPLGRLSFKTTQQPNSKVIR